MADFSALLSLYSELTGALPVLDCNAGLQKLKEIFEHEGTHIFGAEVSGRLVSVAKQEDVVSIVLLTGKGLEAIGFYERCGFDAEEKWGMILKL